ncbi:EamA family transporter [Celeribacter baekdonensis]|uniref:EamA family transporter n=1 Tax=Celeribacter baekdonensis TaxID=875171 RepID=UPI00115FF0D9
MLVGILTTAVPFAAIAWGETRIPSSLGGVLFASIPLFTLLLRLALATRPRHRPDRTRLRGAVIGLLGVSIAAQVIWTKATMSPCFMPRNESGQIMPSFGACSDMI